MGPVIRFVLGTRPEALKILPCVRLLAQRRVAFSVIATGPHTDLLQGTGLRPDVTLNLPSDNDPIAYVERVKEAVENLPTKGVKWVVVQGDTASAWGACWAAVQQGIPVCHVEAGLRSHDLNDPWPEETFRTSIDQLATLRCCPTEGNLANLKAEGLDGVVTGNTIVDQLRAMNVKREPGSHVLITLHRREAFGEPLREILKGLSLVAEQYPDTPFLWPVHPNPHVKEALDATALPVNVMTRPPLPYRGFLTLLASAKAVLTDSGGVVEEACTLGVPIVCCRKRTERSEAFLYRGNSLVGYNSHGVAAALDSRITGAYLDPEEHHRPFADSPALATCIPQSEVFGDGHAAERVADLLMS